MKTNTPKKEAKYGKGGLRQQVNFDVAQQFVADTCPTFFEEHVKVRRVAVIPKAALSQVPGLEAILRKAATVVPTPKKNFITQKVENPPWPMYIDEPTCLCLPRLLAVQLFNPGSDKARENILVNHGVDLVTKDDEPGLPLFNSVTMSEHPDRIDQEKVVETALADLQKQRAQCKFGGVTICVPPSKGKTGMAMHLAHRLGGRTLFVVPNVNMMQQVVGEVRAFLGEHVRVGTMHTSEQRNWKEDIISNDDDDDEEHEERVPRRKRARCGDINECDFVITTHESLRLCDYDLSGFRTVIVDEAHETLSMERCHMYFKLATENVIALTATPERRDNAGWIIEIMAGRICYFLPVEIGKTVWGGLKLNCIKLRYAHNPLDITYKMLGGKKRMDTEHVYRQMATHPARSDWLVNFVCDMAAQCRNVLILGQRIPQMLSLANHLKERGINHGLVVGQSNMPMHVESGKYLTEKELADLLLNDPVKYTFLKAAQKPHKPTPKELDEVRKRQVLIFTDKIGYKALNVVGLDVILMLEPPNRGIDNWLQRIGRVIRTLKNKRQPIIYFVVDVQVPGFLSRTEKVIKDLLDFDPHFEVSETQVLL
jgi:hypothetical protein